MPQLVRDGLTEEEFLELKDAEDGGRDMIQSAVTNTNPVSIHFSKLNYSIEVGKNKERKTKHILRGLSGTLNVGTMTAIMGPTGSGKTSLLNILANRMPVVKGAALGGELLVNGGHVSTPEWGRRFARLSAYVMQEDVMNAYLSVRETLLMAAAFQLPPSTTDGEKARLVNAVISELGLNKVGDTFIGSSSVRGVSGGERKRANIGVELIKNPSALFLDEPTSGLDSFQAQSVMTCMGRLSRNGRTVVASIHQPRSSIYSLFDQLYLISEGRAMFAGPAADAVAYFAALDPAYACPPLFNPADWFLDLTSADYRGAEVEKSSIARIDALAANWESPGGQSSTAAAAEEERIAETEAEGAPLEPLPTYQSSFARQVQLVAWRSGVAVTRNRGAIIGKIAPSLFFALILGAIYSGVENNQKGIQDKIGVLFFFTINQTFGNMFGVLNAFSDEKVVVERERAAKSYRLSSFYVGKLAAELPMNLVGPVIFGSVVYWLVGLNDLPGRFFTFLLILIETGFAAIGLGMVVAAAAPNAQVATAMAPIIVVLMILFGGFYINVDSLPDAIAWIQYLSIMRWSFMGLAVNEFTDTTFSCDDVAEGDTCTATGEEVLRRLSFEDETTGEACLGLFVLIVAFNVLAYTILRINKRKYQAFDKVE